MGSVCCKTPETAVSTPLSEQVVNPTIDTTEAVPQTEALPSGLAGMALAAPSKTEEKSVLPPIDPAKAAPPVKTEPQIEEKPEPPPGAPKKRAKPAQSSLDEDQLKALRWTAKHRAKLNELTRQIEKGDGEDEKLMLAFSTLDEKKPDLGDLEQQDNETGDLHLIGRGDRVECTADSGFNGDNEDQTRKKITCGSCADILFVDSEEDYLLNVFWDGKHDKPLSKPFQQWVFKHNFTQANFEYKEIPGISEWKRLGGRALEPLMDVTTLVDVRWLLKHAQAKDIVPAQQNVPEIGIAKLQEMQYCAECDAIGLPVAVLSYGWAAKGHPDPTGEQLQHLLPALELIVKAANESQVEIRRQEDDLKKAKCTWGMVWDFMSLPQRGYTKEFDANIDDRTPKQISIFKRGLKGINEWYGHEHTFTLVLNTPMPPGAENPAHYDVRGWCIFERRMSSLIKCSSCYLEMDKENLAANKEFKYLVADCTNKRPAPMAPDVFTKMLLEGVEKESKQPGTGIKFTSGKDLTEIVIPQYEKGFRRIMGQAQELMYDYLDWRDKDAEDLADTLLWMARNDANPKLYMLVVRGNKITDQGGKALARAMAEGAFQGIIGFHFMEMKCGDDTADAFAEAIEKGLFGSNETAKWAKGFGASFELKFSGSDDLRHKFKRNEAPGLSRLIAACKKCKGLSFVHG